MGSGSRTWPRILLRCGVGGVLCANLLALPPGEIPQAEALTATAVFLLPQTLLAPSITAPASATMGSVAPGGTATVQMAQVKVTSSAQMRWTATVSATDFTTGGGSAGETIARGNLSYWSGPVVTKTGPGTFSAGQSTAAGKVTLDVARTAFSYVTTNSNASSVTWKPTIIISVPSTAVLGTYTGTVTHSVA